MQQPSERQRVCKGQFAIWGLQCSKRFVEKFRVRKKFSFCLTLKVVVVRRLPVVASVEEKVSRCWLQRNDSVPGSGVQMVVPPGILVGCRAHGT
jgi:hypothetical protein